jgi:hypothetical protein
MIAVERGKPVGHSRSVREEETVDKCASRRVIALPQ